MLRGDPEVGKPSCVHKDNHAIMDLADLHPYERESHFPPA